ncbi:hypothetical protein ACLOJK_013479 [Asimina triloba]
MFAKTASNSWCPLLSTLRGSANQHRSHGAYDVNTTCHVFLKRLVTGKNSPRQSSAKQNAKRWQWRSRAKILQYRDLGVGSGRHGFLSENAE